MNKARFFWGVIVTASMIAVFLPVFARAGETVETPSYTAKQLPSWAEDSWFEYRSKWSSGQYKEADEVLTKLHKQALGLGIQRFDIPASVMIKEGETALAAGNTENAVRFGMAATEWSPGDPNGWFFLARAFYSGSPTRISSTVTSSIKAFSTGLDDFWFSFYFMGRLALIVATGLTASFLVFYVFVLIRYIPLLVHGLHEQFGKHLNVPAVWALVLSLILIPFPVGLGPGFIILIGIGLVWFYMSWNERVVSLLFIAVFGSSAFWLPYGVSLFTADRSDELKLLSQVLRGDATASEIARRLTDRGDHDDDWAVLFSIAVQARRDGKFDEALDGYQAVRKLEPDRSSVWNNIGNIDFLKRDYVNAASYYKQALLKDPHDPISHYNLSLVYREQLLFDDAEKEYNAAQQSDQQLIQSFQGMGPIDELYPSSMLWKTAFGDTPLRRNFSQNLFEIALSPIPLGASVAALAVTGGVVLLIWLAVPRRYIATNCALCGKSVCLHCQRRMLDIKTCADCWQAWKHVKRKGDLQLIQRRQIWKSRIAGVVSIFLPGAGHIYLGRATSGVLLLAVFSGVLYSAFYGLGFLRIPGEADTMGIARSVLTIFTLIVLYSKTLFDLVRFPPERR